MRVLSNHGEANDVSVAGEARPRRPRVRHVAVSEAAAASFASAAVNKDVGKGRGTDRRAGFSRSLIKDLEINAHYISAYNDAMHIVRVDDILCLRELRADAAITKNSSLNPGRYGADGAASKFRRVEARLEKIMGRFMLGNLHKTALGDSPIKATIYTPSETLQILLHATIW